MLVVVLDALGDGAVYSLFVRSESRTSGLARAYRLEDPLAARVRVLPSGSGLPIALHVAALLAVLGVAVRREVALVDPQPPRHGRC
jgi:hypothetical protein